MFGVWGMEHERTLARIFGSALIREREAAAAWDLLVAAMPTHLLGPHLSLLGGA